MKNNATSSHTSSRRTKITSSSSSPMPTPQNSMGSTLTGVKLTIGSASLQSETVTSWSKLSRTATYPIIMRSKYFLIPSFVICMAAWRRGSRCRRLLKEWKSWLSRLNLRMSGCHWRTRDRGRWIRPFCLCICSGIQIKGSKYRLWIWLKILCPFQCIFANSNQFSI